MSVIQHTVVETALSGVKFFVGVVVDTPEAAQTWAGKFQGLINNGESKPSEPSIPEFIKWNPTVVTVVREGLDDGGPLDPTRYDVMFDTLLEVTASGPDARITMPELAKKVGVVDGTIRTMNSKLSQRIGRAKEKREKAGKLQNATPSYPSLTRNIDALLDTKWTAGNPAYRLTGSGFKALIEWRDSKS